MSETPPPQDPHEAPTAAGPPPTPGDERRLLRAVGDDRVLAGVCAGLAGYLRIDPLIVRVAAIVLTFFGGASIIAYLAAWALVPSDDGTGHPADPRPSRGRTTAGAVLIVLAGIVLLDGGWGWHGWVSGIVFGLVPTALVVGLLALAGYRMLERRGDHSPTAGRVVGATLLVIAATIAACIAMVGSAWATAAGGGEVVAGLVIALGVAMVVLSFRRHGALWLTVPALVLALPAAVVSAAGIDVDGSIGQRTRTPATVADIPAEYELGVGELVVDLRRLDWPRGGTPVDVALRVGMGHALVLVPEDVCVASDAQAGLGYVGVLGSEAGGADLDEQEGTVDRTRNPALRLTADVGIGALEVRHDRHGRRGDDPRPDAISAAPADQGCAGSRR